MKKQISATQQLLKAAYIAAPALLAASSLSYVLGITIIPPGKTGYAEGVLGAVALMLFVPVYLDLGKKLSEQKKNTRKYCLGMRPSGLGNRLWDRNA